jgi:hypothetical protein
MKNKTYQTRYEVLKERVVNGIADGFDSLYNSISFNDYIDGSSKIKTRNLEGRSKEVGFEVIDTRNKRD